MNQQNELLEILCKSHLFKELFGLWSKIPVENCYVAGGCVTQTVWNALSGRACDYGIRDIDIIYYDKTISKEIETANSMKIAMLLNKLKTDIDVQNEATVHSWYSQKFGYEISPYQDIEDALCTWLPAFAIGVQKLETGFSICAPFGLDDLFDRIVRPNKRQINQMIYINMIERLKADWPEITVLDWE